MVYTVDITRPPTCLYCQVEPSVAAVLMSPVAVQGSLAEDLSVRVSDGGRGRGDLWVGLVQTQSKHGTLYLSQGTCIEWVCGERQTYKTHTSQLKQQW